MAKVKKITVSNLKAIAAMSADFNGCTAIITGGNNRGKSSFLRSLPDRLRGIKPDVVVKTGETEGNAEWELTTGEKFIWHFDTKTKAGERLTFITKENIKTSVTKELSNRYFPSVFDVDEFLASQPKKQREILQKLAGIDFSNIDARYKAAYEERTFANRKRDDLKAALNANPIPAQVDKIEVSELLKQKEEIRAALNQKYLENKEHNDKLRKQYNDNVEAVNIAFEEEKKEMNDRQQVIDDCNAALAVLAKHGYTGKEVAIWINTLPVAHEVIKRKVEEPRYITELPDDSELTAIDKQINDANETNAKALAYDNYLKQKQAADEAEQKATEADKAVKDIEQERMDLIKSAKMPEGFDFSEDGITYNNLPFTREQLSSSGIYIAALKLAAMTLGEVKTLHFDASFLDKNSLADIEKWANENDLQLLIERPDFEGGEIEYQLLNPTP